MKIFSAIQKIPVVPITLFLLSLAVFFASFQHNYFNAAKQDWFDGHQQDSEALVIGRLVKSQADGIISDGARLGRYGGHSGDQNRVQTNLYTGKTTGGNFHGYDSQIGLQGIFFSSIDTVTRKLSSRTAEERLTFYYSINAILLALILASTVLIFYVEFGLGAALIVVATTLTSQWLVVFGRNLYWVTWTMYLPMLAVFVLHKYEEKYAKFSLILVSLIGFILIFIKSAAGYEYITTVLIATAAPIIYFSVKNRWPVKLFLQRMIVVGTALVAGFVVANIVHVLQLGEVNNQSFVEALQGRLDHAKTRLHAEEGAPIGGGMWDKATLASVFEVLNKYWNGEAINLNNLFGFKYFKIITFGDLVLIFAIFSALGLMAENFSRNTAANRTKIIALIATTWFCLAAPLSWFILAKVHSYVHGHMNHLLWHLPFTLFGFALTGYVIALKARDILANKILTAVLIVLLAITYLCFFSYANYQKNNALKNLQQDTFYTYTTKEGWQISFLNNQIAYYHPRCSSVDRKQRFFLHAYPAQGTLSRQFQGLDFNWPEQKVYQPGLLSFGDRSCLAIQDLPDHQLSAVRTGQFTANGTRTWSEHIHLTSSIELAVVTPFNLSDVRWLNGVSREGTSFFVEKTDAHKQLLTKGSVLIFADGSQRKILQVNDANAFINVDVDGRPMNPAAIGFPNVIKIIQKRPIENNDLP